MFNTRRTFSNASTISPDMDEEEEFLDDPDVDEGPSFRLGSLSKVHVCVSIVLVQYMCMYATCSQFTHTLYIYMFVLANCAFSYVSTCTCVSLSHAYRSFTVPPTDQLPIHVHVHVHVPNYQCAPLRSSIPTYEVAN